VQVYRRTCQPAIPAFGWRVHRALPQLDVGVNHHFDQLLKVD
jgi:hypothetical protein